MSAFSGRGKTGPLKHLRKDKQAMDTFINLGKSWDVTQLVNDTLQAFTCHTYASSSKTTKVNVLRHEMFLTKRGEVDSSTLPPCEDSLQQHIQRANYQAGVWQRSLQRNPDVPEPTCHGWVRTEVGSLKIDWMHGHAAPDAVLELLACQCKRECLQERCPCLVNGLKCTYMCRLQACGNRKEDDSYDAPEYESECSDLDEAEY